MVDISAARLQDFLIRRREQVDFRLPIGTRLASGAACVKQRNRPPAIGKGVESGRQVIIGEIGERQRHCEWRTIDYWLSADVVIS